MNKNYKYMVIFGIIIILLVSISTLLLLLPKNTAKQTNISNSNINTNTYFCGDSNISKPLFERITQEDGRFGNGYLTVANYSNTTLNILLPEINILAANNSEVNISAVSYVQTNNLILNLPIFISQSTNSDPDSIVKFYNEYLKAFGASFSQSSEMSDSNSDKILADPETINHYLEQKTLQTNLDLEILRTKTITNINQIPITKLVIQNKNSNAKLNSWLTSKANIAPINSQTNSFLNDLGIGSRYQLLAGNNTKIAKLNKSLGVCDGKYSIKARGIINGPTNFLDESIDSLITITPAQLNAGELLYNSVNILKDLSNTGNSKLININQTVNIRNVSADNAKDSIRNAKINAERSAAVEHDKWMSAHYVASFSPPPGYSKQPIITSDPSYYSNDVQQ